MHLNTWSVLPGGNVSELVEPLGFGAWLMEIGHYMLAQGGMLYRETSSQSLPPGLLGWKQPLPHFPIAISYLLFHVSHCDRLKS